MNRKHSESTNFSVAHHPRQAPAPTPLHPPSRSVHCRPRRPPAHLLEVDQKEVTGALPVVTVEERTQHQSTPTFHLPMGSRSRPPRGRRRGQCRDVSIRGRPLQARRIARHLAGLLSRIRFLAGSATRFMDLSMWTRREHAETRLGRPRRA